MYESVLKAPVSHAMAAPSSGWQQPDFVHSTEKTASPRPGHSFGSGVGIRRSVTPRVQAKMRVSRPGEATEVEADRVADSVMQMPEAALARDAEQVSDSSDIVNRCGMDEKGAATGGKKSAEEAAMTKLEEDKEAAAATEEDKEAAAATEEDKEAAATTEEDKEAAAATDEDKETAAATEEGMDKDEVSATSEGSPSSRVTPRLASRIKDVHSAGAPLPKQTREFFEPRFGQDFGDVRIQTGSQAASVSRDLHAKAFTVGNNITFAEGNFSPNSSDGKRLLAHELTHVVQQRGNRSRR